MLTGELPFDDSNTIRVVYRQINEELPPIETKVSTVSAGTAALVKKMTQKKLSDRYQSPEEVLEDIENIMRGRPTSTSQIMAKAPLKKAAAAKRKMLKKKKRHPILPRWSIIALALGILLLAGLLIWLFR